MLYRGYNYYFWVPIIGPHLGAIAGVITYELMIGIHIGHEDQAVAYGKMTNY